MDRDYKSGVYKHIDRSKDKLRGGFLRRSLKGIPWKQGKTYSRR